DLLSGCTEDSTTEIPDIQWRWQPDHQLRLKIDNLLAILFSNLNDRLVDLENQSRQPLVTQHADSNRLQCVLLFDHILGATRILFLLVPLLSLLLLLLFSFFVFLGFTSREHSKLRIGQTPLLFLQPLLLIFLLVLLILFQLVRKVGAPLGSARVDILRAGICSSLSTGSSSRGSFYTTSSSGIRLDAQVFGSGLGFAVCHFAIGAGASFWLPALLRHLSGCFRSRRVCLSRLAPSFHLACFRPRTFRSFFRCSLSGFHPLFGYCGGFRARAALGHCLE